jgi:hypothetical protein
MKRCRLSARFLLTNPLRRLDSVHHGHLRVHQDQAVSPGGVRRARLRPVGHDMHVAAEALQEALRDTLLIVLSSTRSTRPLNPGRVLSGHQCCA